MFLGNLDDTDQKIITLLTENARMSYSDIGVRVGLSRVAVKSRIQALEERGIIEEYTTIILRTAILSPKSTRFPAAAVSTSTPSPPARRSWNRF